MARRGSVSARRQPRSTSPGARLTGYAYVLPALVLVTVFIYYCIAYNVAASQTQWNGISPDRTAIGGRNFSRLWHDEQFRAALKHTLYFGVVTIVVQALIGFSLAWLTAKRVLLRPVYQAIFFAPAVLATAVIAPVAREMLAPDGQVNSFLRFVGLDSQTHAWLADPSTSLYALMVVNIWQWTGFSYVLYYAALCQIDPQVFEAAKLDGAGGASSMGRIAWPMCKSTTASLMVLGAISSLKVFDLVYLTTNGGPAGSTEVASTFIYRQSVLQFHAGYAAAAAIVLLGITLVLTAVQMRLYRPASSR